MLRHACALALGAALLAGCATPISEDKIRSADYGPPPSADHQEQIKAEMAKSLIDPTSPLYEFDAPRKGYTKASGTFGTSERFGWRVCGTVNSKNRFGGYTGRAPFFALFRGGRLVTLLVGEISRDTVNILNASIIGACNRTVT